MGPATAQNFPCVAKRLQISEIGGVEAMRIHFKRINLISRDFDSISPVGELHIHCSISLVPDHIVEGLPGAFRVRRGEVAPGKREVFDLTCSPVGNTCCRDWFRASRHNCQGVVVEVVVPGFSCEIFLFAGILPHQFHHGLFVHHSIMVPCHNQSSRSLVIGEPASVSENNLLPIEA